MFHRSVLLTLLLAVSLLAASCVPIPVTPAADMANPASVFCGENGGVLELRTDAAGGVAGLCVFPDGSECDEWAYFRGECAPGDSLVKPAP